MNYSILDATYDFSDLSNDIERFKKKLCVDLNLPYSEEGVKLLTPTNDIRFITLDSIQQLLLSLSAYIKGFMGLQEKIGNPEKFLKYLNLGVTLEQLENSLLYKFPIESLVTMIHFQIDSYFGELCVISEDPQSGFYNRMVKVLDGSPDKLNAQNTLQCLANFRNSFHYKGIHKIHRKKWTGGIEPMLGELDREFNSEDFKIEFKHNEAIIYNWKSAFLLIKESVEILKQVISLN